MHPAPLKKSPRRALPTGHSTVRAAAPATPRHLPEYAHPAAPDFPLIVPVGNVLQDIFKDYYEEMIYTLHPRKSVIENVDRLINCGDPAFGGAMYGCSSCGTLKFVPFRCHSRFCPTCGTKYSIDRTTSMSFKIINA